MALHRFSDIVGHHLQRDLLVRTAAGGQVAHAWLFEGANGIGKLAVAWAFAARLACLAPGPEGDACGKCRSCNALERGEHPDIALLVRQKASILIDQVREATGRLRYDPVVGRAKVLIVDDADLLREEAANALLKTLEEPASRTFFVLVSGRPQRVLGTIVSRCQRLRFSPLSPDDIVTLLAAEGHDRTSAGIAAALCGGSLHAARALCDARRLEVIDLICRFALGLGNRPSSAAAAFVEELSERIAGLEPIETPQEEPIADAPTASVAEARALARGDAAIAPIKRKSVNKSIKEAAAARTKGLDRDGLAWAVDALRAILRDAMLIGAGVDPSRLPHVRYRDQLEKLAARVDGGALCDVIDSCQAMDDRMVINPNPRLALEALLVSAGDRLTPPRRLRDNSTGAPR